MTLPGEICDRRAVLWATIGGFLHCRCRSCRHLFVSPLPTEAQLEAFYQDSSFYHDALEQQERLRRDFEHRLGLLQRLRNDALPRTLLEVGCAAGFFLECASRRDWALESVERSNDLAAAAAARSDADVYGGRLEPRPRRSSGERMGCAPRVVDRLGWGSEMIVAFRKVGA